MCRILPAFFTFICENPEWTSTSSEHLVVKVKIHVSFSNYLQLYCSNFFKELHYNSIQISNTQILYFKAIL